MLMIPKEIRDEDKERVHGRKLVIKYRGVQLGREEATMIKKIVNDHSGQELSAQRR